MRFVVSVCGLFLAACQLPEPIRTRVIDNCTVNIEPGGGLWSKAGTPKPSFRVHVGRSPNYADIRAEGVAIKVGGVKVEAGEEVKLAVDWSPIKVSIHGCPVCFTRRSVRLPNNLPTLFFQSDPDDPSGVIYMSLHMKRTVIEIPIAPLTTAKRAG